MFEELTAPKNVAAFRATGTTPGAVASDKRRPPGVEARVFTAAEREQALGWSAASDWIVAEPKG